ncbi:alpha-ribazole phosphatase [Chryseobacterium rhizosphaerae]|uniref:alpha-ribazole phosphatase family protein n=1 Tax=Chryseobacterium rhizosphaerae TaxID=395937 RepID=UPI00285AA897|nr:alpha-ribazole phosphatase family protein [Chryseobacterium rhizosphaerae]MDR6545350.1 alpha-ribazole phosphatase [Chryseobacterium rhizosphaerae]
MEIHLIRHTEVENPENRCYGWAEMPLRKDYLEDLKNLDMDRDFDLVISSPAQRCCLLADYFGFDYTTDERLREMNFGSWEMKKWTDIPEEEINPWYQDFIHVKATDGENLLEMQNRVRSFWSQLITEQNINKALIIAHAGVIRLILQSVLDFPLENMFSIRIDYGKKVIIQKNDKYFSIKKMNV